MTTSAFCAESAPRSPWWLAAALCLGLGLPVTVSAQLPGRLFTTPAERARLDELRSEAPETQPATADKAESDAGIAVPVRREPLTMDGLVVRSGGPNTAWIDGKTVMQNEQVEKGVQVDIRRMNAQGAAIGVEEGAASVRVKVGQTFDPRKKQVTETFEARSVEKSRLRGQESVPADAPVPQHSSPQSK